MRVRVGVRDSHFDIQVGTGQQSLLWLANAALCRYDSTFALELGPPVGLRLEDGTQLPLQAQIQQQVQDGQLVFLTTQQEDEVEDDRHSGREHGEEDQTSGTTQEQDSHNNSSNNHHEDSKRDED